MRAYFSQFGEISRLRLSRNKKVRLLGYRHPSYGVPKLHIKTGRSKHYGFIEFVSAPVAQIVAETMDNYLLMGHILTCKVIPKDEVHPELWVGANRKWRVIPTYRLAQAQHNKVRSPASRLNSGFLIWLLQPRNEIQRRTAENRLMKRQEARKRKIAEAGIVYNFYNFEKVGYVSGPVPCAMLDQRSNDSPPHRKNLKALHDNIETMYFIDLMHQNSCFYMNDRTSWALNLLPPGQNLTLKLVRQL